LQALKARDNLTGYARQQYDNVTAQAQQGLIEFAQELAEEDLHVRMPDAVKKSSWKRQFKSHDKVKKRLMTATEAAEKDADKRQQIADTEARLQSTESFSLSFNAEPIRPSLLLTMRFTAPLPPLLSSSTSPAVDRVSQTPSSEALAAVNEGERVKDEEDEEEEEEEEEEKEKQEPIDDPFVPPPSTAPATMQMSRAGRKRAPTMKALEAERAPKRVTGQGRGRGQGRGARGGKAGRQANK